MLFYAQDEATARGDFKRLVDLAVRATPPGRAKVHLAKYAEDKYAVALIYPAEHDEEVSSWLLEGTYRTAGAAEGGVGAVERYYRDQPEVLETHQFFGASETISRSGAELLAAVPRAVQR
jgi:hypothetical protein